MLLYHREITFILCELNKNVRDDIMLLKQMVTGKVARVQCAGFL